MSDRLRMDPMDGDELKVFMVYSRQAYIDDRVSHGGEDPLDAEAAAARSMAECFPDGQAAEGHALFIGRDAATGERTGVLWLCESQKPAGTSVFIYDIEVDEARRGKGWGRDLLAFAEQWAVERGAYEIGLNVFGGNAVARGLYTSVGYDERSVGMAKSLKSLMSRTALNRAAS